MNWWGACSGEAGAGGELQAAADGGCGARLLHLLQVPLPPGALLLSGDSTHSYCARVVHTSPSTQLLCCCDGMMQKPILSLDTS